MRAMVSVIMPCYNAGKFIQEAIQSVREQTYTDWELLVVDDGSTDNSADIVECMTLQDERIHLIKQPNSGACRARNNGIEHARGEYVKFLDADDILFSTALAEQIKQISVLGLRQIPFGDYNNIDEKGSVLSEYHFNDQERLKNDAIHFFFSEWRVLISCPLHRTTLLREIGGFNEQLMRGQESDLHLRLALADVEWIYFPTIIFSYRDYTANHRISCLAPVYTYKRRLCDEQRMQVCEKLFINKYGNVPQKYSEYFERSWFDKARREFAEKKTDDGIIALHKAKKYGFHSLFEQTYYHIGKIVGYELLENIFQLRLKLISKND